MDVRGKLIDLIIDAKRTDPETGSFTEYLADCLVNNGVTVQEWISVTERFPEERGYYIVAVKHWPNGNMETRYEFWNGGGWISRYNLSDPMVTHWMSLPEPPKGE